MKQRETLERELEAAIFNVVHEGKEVFEQIGHFKETIEELEKVQKALEALDQIHEQNLARGGRRGKRANSSQRGEDAEAVDD